MNTGYVDTKAVRPTVDDVKPWDRQPGETAKAYAAFLLYRDLPAIDRSVSAARERHQRDTKGTLRQWKGWSMRNGWMNRAAEHDSDLASLSRQLRLENYYIPWHNGRRLQYAVS